MKKGYVNFICIFWFLKFIFDLFYQFKILSLIISGIAILLLIVSLSKQSIKFNKLDLIVILMILLWSISFFKSPSYYIDYFKIISAFVLYFLGRLYSTEEEKIENTITKTLLLVLIVNLIICLIGRGSIVWGSAITLRGLYYFKTDFSCMLSFFLIFWLMNCPYSKRVKIFFAIIAIILIILANSRIYYLITGIILLIIYMYKKEKKIFTLKNIIIVLATSILLIFGISMLSKLSFFSDRNLISLNFHSFEDIFNASNTQGRNEIWEKLLTNFNNQSITTKILGAELSFNDNYGYRSFSEHSTYIKTLINTGYLGVLLFVIFIIKVFKSLLKLKNKKLEFITILLLMVFLISGFSSPTILYINCSWLPMFYIGTCISIFMNDKKEEERRK